MTKHAQRLELDKILFLAANYAVSEGGRRAVLETEPTGDLFEAEERLSRTEEAKKLLFELGGGKLAQFSSLLDVPERAEKGATLSCEELLSCAVFLRTARECYENIHRFSGELIPKLSAISERLIFDKKLEQNVFEKILSENELADTASELLYSLRQKIRLLNEKIRARLADFLTGEESKFLQEPIVTMRADRFVIPVKAEYKRSVKGFIHDCSKTGQTVFIEPEEVLEMNNELKTLQFDEKEEIERILKELSMRVGRMRSALETDEELLILLDSYYARAEYAYALKCVRPALNKRGILDIKKGRHPLLDQKAAVPVSISLGKDYSFLLLSGANTGGKTVTLKMCGLFCLMAACGLFVPAAEDTALPVFDRIYCDIGDRQSIEENLSTFSSHVLNLKEICEEAAGNSFVLIDEPGGGTDPEEGQALARAVLVTLLKKGCKGIVTTHFSALKEFAFSEKQVENGCMEFDAKDLRPLYRLKIGYPGSSNALLICARLGLDEKIIEEARAHLSDGAKAFEHTVRAAEESRVKSEELLLETEKLKKSWQEKLSALEKEEAELQKEKEKFLRASKAEAKRIVARRTEEAEELVGKIEEIFEKQNLTEADLIKARTLKNRVENLPPAEEQTKTRLENIDPKMLKIGDRVLVGSLDAEGVVLSLKREKETAEVQCGALKVQSKFSELFKPVAIPKKEEGSVRVVKNLQERRNLARECNVIGLSASEAEIEVEAFLDGAILQNLKEVRIVHGMGTGTLKKTVHALLRKHPHVEEFRLGKYGEGESGVTVVTLK